MSPQPPASLQLVDLAYQISRIQLIINLINNECDLMLYNPASLV